MDKFLLIFDIVFCVVCLSLALICEDMILAGCGLFAGVLAYKEINEPRN
jgi:hypothetical protein